MTDTKCEPPKPWANEWHWVEKDGKKSCAYWWQTMENHWEWFGICPDGAGGRSSQGILDNCIPRHRAGAGGGVGGRRAGHGERTR